MKSKIIIPILFFLFALPWSSFSQPAGTKFRSGFGKAPWNTEGQCWKASDLNLTPDQTRALEIIQRTHLGEIQLLRAELFAKRLEVREFLINPATKIDSIRSKSTEIATLQSKLEEKTVEYLIKMKNLLTQEQLKSWCPELEFPFPRRMMHGPGSMGPMSPRRPPPSEGTKEE
jgi:Spy/CpxP family protein refolding chaperone